MDLQEYEEKVKYSEEINYLNTYILELIEIFADLTNVTLLEFHKYEYEYNVFINQFCINRDEENSSQSNKEYKIFLKNNDVVYGYLQINKRIISTPTIKKIISKIIKYLKREKDIERKLYGNDLALNLYLIHDGSVEFATNLKKGFEGLFNADITMDTKLEKYLDDINKKNSKNIIVLLISDIETINKYENILKKINELVIVLGPNDHHISMLCGKLGINDYLSITSFQAIDLKSVILNKRNNLLNKNKFGNKIIGVTGISGGVGATTIAMNTANLIARNQPNKNVLYLDLSTTKAISNLFLEKNPLPSKTIIDLVNLSEFNLETNLDNGLNKIRENFYSVTGIQKHIDKDLIEKEVFLEKFMNYISLCSAHFNYIIVDIGIADASNLKSTLYDLSSELWIVTEMTLPDISKLKTFHSLLKRAGLKDKISFIPNRYDSQNALSINDVSSILNIKNDEKEHFDQYKIPNDYKNLGELWNFCELVTDKNMKSPFVDKLDHILEKNELYTKDHKKESKGLFSFLKGSN